MEEASSRGFIADVLVIAALLASMWLMTDAQAEQEEQVGTTAATGPQPPKADVHPGRGEAMR